MEWLPVKWQRNYLSLLYWQHKWVHNTKTQIHRLHNILKKSIMSLEFHAFHKLPPSFQAVTAEPDNTKATPSPLRLVTPWTGTGLPEDSKIFPAIL